MSRLFQEFRLKSFPISYTLLLVLQLIPYHQSVQTLSTFNIQKDLFPLHLQLSLSLSDTVTHQPFVEQQLNMREIVFLQNCKLIKECGGKERKTSTQQMRTMRLQFSNLFFVLAFIGQIRLFQRQLLAHPILYTGYCTYIWLWTCTSDNYFAY